MTDNVLSCTKTLKMEAGGGGSGLIVSVPDTRSRDMGSSPSQGHFVVFLDKTLLSQCLSPPRCINLILGVTLGWTSIPSQAKQKYS